MTIEAWLASGVVLVVFLVLAFTSIAPYLAILGGICALLISGIVGPAQALSGFSNPGVVTIGALFIVAAGLNETGGIVSVVQRILGRPNTARSAQARLIPPVTFASAFLNNTPIVAMLMPMVKDWSKRINVPVTQLLIPLSYAAILGGMCTLIGTSTNLVVHGLLVDFGLPGLRMFDITSVGLPCAIAGIVFLLAFGKWLLPWREEAGHVLEDPREYTLEMVVSPGGALVGRRISEAGLRHLPGVYLMEIHRRDAVIPAVGPEERLEADDQLIFVGLIDSVVDLQKIPGLRPATRQLFKLDAPRSERWFVEAVISHSCPIVGQNIREGRFRNKYNSVVIGVARNGYRINRRIGDIVLQPGDVLLLEALPSFVEQHRSSTDFYLVSRIQGTNPPRHDRAYLATAIVAAMIALAATGIISMLQAATAAAAAMLITRCCSEEAARRRVDWQLLLAIAGAFGLGHALDSTGAAQVLAETVLTAAGASPQVTLIFVFGIAQLLAAMVTSPAAAVVVFPVAIEAAGQLGVHYMPFIVALMVGSAASFASPLGYQTNLMVYGAGGYRFGDFVRVGLPMSLVLWVVTVIVTPMFWPF